MAWNGRLKGEALSNFFNWANGSSDTRENPAKNSTRPAFGYHRHHRQHQFCKWSIRITENGQEVLSHVFTQTKRSRTTLCPSENADIHVHTFDTFQSHAPPCATTATVTALEHLSKEYLAEAEHELLWESTEQSHGTTSGIGFSNFHPERRTGAHKQGIR